MLRFSKAKKMIMAHLCYSCPTNVGPGSWCESLYLFRDTMAFSMRRFTNLDGRYSDERVKYVVEQIRIEARYDVHDVNTLWFQNRVTLFDGLGECRDA